MIRHALGVLTVASAALLALGARAQAQEDPCRPVTPACTAEVDGRLQQAAAAFAATESGGLLRGMGLASFTGILGRKKGKATEARLDAELVSQLVSAPIVLADRIAPADTAPGIIDVVQEAGHRKLKLHRQLHIEMEVNRCPKQLEGNSRTSNEHMAIDATYELVTSWREGKTSVGAGLVIRLFATDVNAYVDQNARFAGFKDVFLAPELSVTRFGERRRAGKPPQIYSNTVNLDLSPGEVGWDVTRATAAESWDAFTSGESKRPAPGREPRLISEKAYADLANAFMKMIDAELLKRVAEAEKVWQTPNACATVLWDPTTGTANVPKDTELMITGRIAPTSGLGLNGLREHWAPSATVGTISEQLSAGSAEGQPMSLRVKGGEPTSDGITVELHYRTPSTIGVVEGTWTTNGQGPPDHYMATFSGFSATGDTWNGTANFDLAGVAATCDDLSFPPTADTVRYCYKLVDGSANWTYTDPQTQAVYQTTVTLLASTDFSFLELRVKDPDPSRVNSYNALLYPNPGAHSLAVNGGQRDANSSVISWIGTSGGPYYAGGTYQLMGTQQLCGGGVCQGWTWNFLPSL